MSDHIATIIWERTTDGFGYEEYDRTHTWLFDSGLEIKATASPEFRGRSEYVDPEEAFVASLSSCHMLTFLAVAARKRLIVDSYEDAAIGHMENNGAGKLAITRVNLNPRVAFSQGVAMNAEALEQLHRDAHDQCFLANSVMTEIIVHPQA